MRTKVTLLVSAAHFAAVKHGEQRRKDKARTPYINHPLDVARILAEEGGVTDPLILAAAILHDVLEDTKTTPEELRREFGDRVSDLVEEVTDNKSLPKKKRKELQVLRASNKSRAAALIKIADKISNLRDLERAPPVSWSHERRRQYRSWAQDVISKLPVKSGKLVAAAKQLSN